MSQVIAAKGAAYFYGSLLSVGLLYHLYNQVSEGTAVVLYFGYCSGTISAMCLVWYCPGTAPAWGCADARLPGGAFLPGERAAL